MIHLNDIIMFAIQLKIAWLIVEHYQSYLVMMIMYVVEHDEFDIHDNKHENRYHNNMMLSNWHAHDRKWWMGMRSLNSKLLNYHYGLDLRKVEKKNELNKDGNSFEKLDEPVFDDCCPISDRVLLNDDDESNCCR